MECAGLCLSMEKCNAFEFSISTTGSFSCVLYEKEGICIIQDNNSVEIYANQNENIPACPGIIIYIVI